MNQHREKCLLVICLIRSVDLCLCVSSNHWCGVEREMSLFLVVHGPPALVPFSFWLKSVISLKISVHGHYRNSAVLYTIRNKNKNHCGSLTSVFPFEETQWTRKSGI